MDEKELQDLKPFEQTPYWDPNSTFTLSGSEFERIYSVLAPFIGVGFILQSKLDQGIREGVVKVKYEYTDGSGEVPQEVVKEYTEMFLKMLQEKQDADSAEINDENVKPLNSKKTKKIITDI